MRASCVASTRPDSPPCDASADARPEHAATARGTATAPARVDMSTPDPRSLSVFWTAWALAACGGGTPPPPTPPADAGDDAPVDDAVADAPAADWVIALDPSQPAGALAPAL